MAFSLRASNATNVSDRSVRVMRWRLRRRNELLTFELGLNHDDSAYELRIDPPWNPTRVTNETFSNAIAAFTRHASIERQLIEDGWSLESFESGSETR